MTINIPQQDGTLAPFFFNKANTLAYNNAVNSLHSNESVANNQAIWAQ